MDFYKLIADTSPYLDKHYTKSRHGKKIRYIVVHYNAGDLTVEGCWRVWQTRKASAHYQVESSGRIGQLVHDADTAWHAGNFDVNCESIGIEHANKEGGYITEQCLDAGAHLVAALCRAYNLGSPAWGVNVFPHRHFAATACPGRIGDEQRTHYMERADYYYKLMTGAQVADGFQQVNGKWKYYRSGSPVVSGWVNDSGNWYYFDHAGDMFEGWLWLADVCYYLEPGSGHMLTGRHTITTQDGNPQVYDFDEKGALLHGWHKMDGKDAYSDPDWGVVQPDKVKDPEPEPEPEQGAPYDIADMFLRIEQKIDQLLAR